MKMITKKRCVFVSVLGLCIGIAIGVAGASLVENIKAELRRDFTVVVDGQTKTFRDVNGNQVYPLLYEGTTYLPVRAVGELMGKEVLWFENEKKVELRDKTGASGGSTVTDADLIITDDYSGSQTGGLITLDEAKSIVLTKAGLAAEDVTFTKTKLDRDDGIVKYEIDFRTATMEYETELNAADGNIIEWELDAVRGANNAGANNGGTSSNNNAAVTLDEAKDIALRRAGVKAEDATFTKQQSDIDNGRRNYDIEFVSGGTEYEAEIDAETGEIIEWKTEALKGYQQGIGVGPAINTDNGVITLEEAQNIALERAGLSGTNVTFTKAKLERDDGIQKYELEFRYNGREYEAEINAATGAIIEYDSEYDDDHHYDDHH